MSDFDAGAKAAFPTMVESVDDAAFRLANELIDTGHSATEATSIVANILIWAAWKTAGAGRIADGEQPRPDKFREAVERALIDVKFNSPRDIDTPRERKAP